VNAQHILRWVGAEAFVASDIRPGPSLLRFDGDDFMERMLALLAEQPQELPTLVAKAESWTGVGAPTPLPPSLQPTDKPFSRPARALARTKNLLGFRRSGEGSRTPESPLTTRQAMLAAMPPTAKPLKLFQPVHQRYYLAAAHLVCERPGLPPRVAGSGDRSGFVIRRLVGSGAAEYGFASDGSGQKAWLPASNAGNTLVPGEELLPVFPLSYAPPNGPQRQLLAGLIPVARHDDYRFARRADAAPPPGRSGAWSAADDIRALARMKVIAPWQGLIERAYQSGRTSLGLTAQTPWHDETPPDTATADNLKTLNDQLVEASWRLLQEMREFLLASFADLTPAVLASGSVASSGRPELQALLDFLGRDTWRKPADSTLPADRPQLSDTVLDLADPYAHASLRAALAAMDDTLSTTLDAMSVAFPNGLGWPGWAFPLVVLRGGKDEDSETSPDGTAKKAPRLDGPFRHWPGFAGTAGEALQDADNRRLELLFDRLAAAIGEAATLGRLNGGAQANSAARMAGELEASLAANDGPPRYVIRFVHQHCDCGALRPPVISAPSEVFELAGFFDAEAPMRPIRIALPFDTTPGGLRKYGKNSAFIISDLLCGQMKRVRRLGFGDLVLSVLPWPFHKDLDVGTAAPCGDPGSRFGTICSLSIPIITLVAFVLLIVIATLLDLIFHWLPFLIACFPVPGLKGKNK